MFFYMFYKNNCYIYSDANAGISHREDFQITDTPESFRISRTSFVPVQNTFKLNVLGLIFSKVEDLHLLSLLKNKHFLGYIFKTPILRTHFSLKNMWCLLK